MVSLSLYFIISLLCVCVFARAKPRAVSSINASVAGVHYHHSRSARELHVNNGSAAIQRRCQRLFRRKGFYIFLQRPSSLWEGENFPSQAPVCCRRSGRWAPVSRSSPVYQAPRCFKKQPGKLIVITMNSSPIRGIRRKKSLLSEIKVLVVGSPSVGKSGWSLNFYNNISITEIRVVSQPTAINNF